VRELSPGSRQPPPQLANMQPEYGYVQENQEPSLRDYWRMLRKRRLLVFLVFLTILGLGIFVTVWWTPQYTSTTTIKIDLGNSSVPDSNPTGEDYLQTQIALLKGRALAAKVIIDLGLTSHPKFIDSPNPIKWLHRWLIGSLQSPIKQLSDLVSERSGSAPPDTNEPVQGAMLEPAVQRLIGRYQSFLEVEQVRGTRLVKVSFTTGNPKLSRDLATAHAANYIRTQLETRFELTKEAREFLEKKLAELKVKLERSEQTLQRFRQANGVVSVAGGENVVVDRLVELNRRLTETRTKRIELESLAQIVKGKNIEYLSQVVANGLIVQFKGRLEVLEAERAKLATIFKPDHPRVVELDQQLKEARRRLNVELNNVVRGIDSDYSAVRAREAALQAEAERQQQAALEFKELGIKYNLLQGEVDANRTIYDGVVKRLNETSISSDTPLSSIQITDPAEKPLFPSSPKIPLNLMLATAFGLFLAVGVAFLVEHLDSTVRTTEDVWGAMGVPTLGVVPHMKGLARREYGFSRLPGNSSLRRLTPRWARAGSSLSAALMVSYHPLSIIAESYRTIRTVLLLGHGEQSPQVILLTSAHPGEGKTTITLNLAITLAQSGRNVVVVDADLRKGNCHAHLAMQNRYGLSHLLTDRLPLEVCLQSSGVPGLSLIPRGTVPHNPTDLLGSSKMHDVLAVLRERFDFVLIDTAPALAISDAAVLSVLCDGVLLVLRSQNTTTDAARHVVEHLQAVGARILGAVLNGIDIRDPDYSDYRKYYASYYAAAQRGEESPR
jgi:succinoglycan biosynthesis transport protein ExoP